MFTNLCNKIDNTLTRQTSVSSTTGGRHFLVCTTSLGGWRGPCRTSWWLERARGTCWRSWRRGSRTFSSVSCRSPSCDADSRVRWSGTGDQLKFAWKCDKWEAAWWRCELCDDRSDTAGHSRHLAGQVPAVVQGAGLGHCTQAVTSTRTTGMLYVGHPAPRDPANMCKLWRLSYTFYTQTLRFGIKMRTLGKTLTSRAESCLVVSL